MEPTDIESLSHLGHVLWVNSDRSLVASAEALAAVTLRHGSKLGQDQASPQFLVETTVQTLLHRANEDGMPANATAMNLPFFRLLPEERLILWALHRGRWSYQRIAKVLSKTSEEIAETAWTARRRLGQSFPNGASRKSPGCMEYNPANPWTQRFLDEELSPREKVFLQSHLNACEGCRQTLNRYRNLYFELDKWIPKPKDPVEERERMRVLHSVARETRGYVRPSERSLAEVLWIFANRTDVMWMLGVGSVGLIIWLLV